MDFSNLFGEAVLKTVISKGVDGIYNLYKKNNFQREFIKKLKNNSSDEEFKEFKIRHSFDVNTDEVIESVKENLYSSNMWSSEVNFRTALASKELRKVFVEIDLYLSQKKDRFDVNENLKKINSKNFLKEYKSNAIIYGGAGAGKTTLIKKLYNDYILTHTSFGFQFPIVIRLREFDYESIINPYSLTLFDVIQSVLGIKIKLASFNKETAQIECSNFVKKIIISFLNECKVLLIVDGFDEIPDILLKKRFERDFQQLALSLKESSFILTSRNNEFLLKIENTKIYEICPLNDSQIKELIKKWLGNQKKADDLFEKIVSSPYYDTTMRPLTLAHLCAIYERKKTIPPKPRYIYDFVLNLLLEAWDQQRSIVRPSQYADFYIEKKKEFLAHMSYWLTSNNQNKNVFKSDDIRRCYLAIHESHNLPASQAKKVVTELEAHTGIFVQSGYDYFEFSHKSLQEFLTARHLFSLPEMPDISLIENLPNEAAILLSLSSSPNLYFDMFRRQFNKIEQYFWHPFIIRLLEEKPDFDSTPSVIIFFIENIWNNPKTFWFEAFSYLLENSNLAIGVKQLFNFYISSIDSGYTTLTYKNLNIPIDKRKYYPGQLFMTAETYKLLRSYSR